MATIQQLYNLIKEGKGAKDVFMKQAKKQFPKYLLNRNTYEECVQILKNKNILWESNNINQGIVDLNNHLEEPYEVKFKQFLLKEDDEKANLKKPSKEVDGYKDKSFHLWDNEIIDNLSGEQLRQGYYTELTDPKNSDKTKQQLIDIVVKNMQKDPLYYVTQAQFGVKGIGYRDDLPGLKASKSDQMIPVPSVEKQKSNVSDDLGNKEKGTKTIKGVEQLTYKSPKGGRGIKKMEVPKEKFTKINEALRGKKHLNINTKLKGIHEKYKKDILNEKLKNIEDEIKEQYSKFKGLTENGELGDFIDKKKLKELRLSLVELGQERKKIKLALSKLK